MPNCQEHIKALFEENPNLTDKEAVAGIKKLKDEKGRRLYKTATIALRLRLFRTEQKVPSPESSEIKKPDEEVIDNSKLDAPELKNVDLEGAKKEVEEAFGRRDEMNNDVKNVEPQEMTSGHKKYDGRTDVARREIDGLINDINNKPQGTTKETDSTNEKIMTALNHINEKVEEIGKEILQLKQGGLPVEDKLVDVQLRESIIGKLDEIKEDESQELSKTINDLIDKKIDVKETKPEFLEKLSLNKKGEAHGKLFLHNDRWRFVKRARPIIYGISGAVVGGVSVTVIFILLKALELLPEWL